MGFLKKLGKGLKKGFKKLGANLKKHGPAILGVGLASMIPGVGGLLGKALGTGGSGFMGGLFTKAGMKNALIHHGDKYLKKKGLGGGLLQKALGGQQQAAPQTTGGMMPGIMPMSGMMGMSMMGQNPLNMAMQSPNLGQTWSRMQQPVAQSTIPHVAPQEALEMGQLQQHSYL